MHPRPRGARFYARLYKISEMERELNFTVDNKYTVEEMANRGKSRIPKAFETSKWVQVALKGDFSVEDFFIDKWELPAGAFHGSEGGAF